MPELNRRSCGDSKLESHALPLGQSPLALIWELANTMSLKYCIAELGGALGKRSILAPYVWSVGLRTSNPVWPVEGAEMMFREK